MNRVTLILRAICFPLIISAQSTVTITNALAYPVTIKMYVQQTATLHKEFYQRDLAAYPKQEIAPNHTVQLCTQEDGPEALQFNRTFVVLTQKDDGKISVIRFKAGTSGTYVLQEQADGTVACNPTNTKI